MLEDSSIQSKHISPKLCVLRDHPDKVEGKILQRSDCGMVVDLNDVNILKKSCVIY
jgi:hypothetical protein